MKLKMWQNISKLWIFGKLVQEFCKICTSDRRPQILGYPISFGVDYIAQGLADLTWQNRMVQKVAGGALIDFRGYFINLETLCYFCVGLE